MHRIQNLCLARILVFFSEISIEPNLEQQQKETFLLLLMNHDW